MKNLKSLAAAMLTMVVLGGCGEVGQFSPKEVFEIKSSTAEGMESEAETRTRVKASSDEDDLQSEAAPSTSDETSNVVAEKNDPSIAEQPERKTPVEAQMELESEVWGFDEMHRIRMNLPEEYFSSTDDDLIYQVSIYYPASIRAYGIGEIEIAVERNDRLEKYTGTCRIKAGSEDLYLIHGSSSENVTGGSPLVYDGVAIFEFYTAATKEHLTRSFTGTSTGWYGKSRVAYVRSNFGGQSVYDPDDVATEPTDPMPSYPVPLMPPPASIDSVSESEDAPESSLLPEAKEGPAHPETDELTATDRPVDEPTKPVQVDIITNWRDMSGR